MVEYNDEYSETAMSPSYFWNLLSSEQKDKIFHNLDRDVRNYIPNVSSDSSN